jgi:hypothetical protein
MRSLGRMKKVESLRFRWALAVRDSYLAPPGLAPPSRHIAHVLSMHMGPTGEDCHPGVVLLQDETGYSRSTLLLHLRHLQDAGWLRLMRKGSSFKNANVYHPTVPSPWRGVFPEWSGFWTGLTDVPAENPQGTGPAPVRTGPAPARTGPAPARTGPADAQQVVQEVVQEVVIEESAGVASDDGLVATLPAFVLAPSGASPLANLGGFPAFAQAAPLPPKPQPFAAPPEELIFDDNGMSYVNPDWLAYLQRRTG